MTTISTKQVLDNLLEEIQNSDPEMLAPPHPLEKEDKPIGVLTDDLIKKTFSLSNCYRREAKRLQVDIEAEGKTIKNDQEFHRLKSKHELLAELTWFLL